MGHFYLVINYILITKRKQVADTHQDKVMTLLVKGKSIQMVGKESFPTLAKIIFITLLVFH